MTLGQDQLIHVANVIEATSSVPDASACGSSARDNRRERSRLALAVSGSQKNSFTCRRLDTDRAQLGMLNLSVTGAQHTGGFGNLSILLSPLKKEN